MRTSRSKSSKGANKKETPKSRSQSTKVVKTKNAKPVPKPTNKKSEPSSRSQSVAKKTPTRGKSTQSSQANTKNTTKPKIIKSQTSKKPVTTKSKKEETETESESGSESEGSEPSPKVSPKKTIKKRTNSSKRTASPEASSKPSPAKNAGKATRTSRTKESPAKAPAAKPSRSLQRKQEAKNKPLSSSRSNSKNKAVAAAQGKKGKKSPAKTSKQSPKKKGNQRKSSKEDAIEEEKEESGDEEEEEEEGDESAGEEVEEEKNKGKKKGGSGSEKSEEDGEGEESEGSEEKEDNEEEEEEGEEKERVASPAMEIEKPRLPDLSIPDPLTGFIRNSQGQLIKAGNQNEKENEIRKNLDQLLDDENCQIKINITAVDKNRMEEEEESEESVSSEESEGGIITKGYSLYEDWKILEAAEAYKISHKGPRGLLGKNIWQIMTDPHDGGRLLGGKHNARSLCNRYSKYLIYLSDLEKRAIRYMGREKPEYDLMRLKCRFQAALHMKYLTGLFKEKLGGPYGIKSILVISPSDLVKDVPESSMEEEVEESESKEEEEKKSEEKEKEESEEEEEEDFEENMRKVKLSIEKYLKKHNKEDEEDDEEGEDEEEEEEENLILQHGKKSKEKTNVIVEEKKVIIQEKTLKRPFVEKKGLDEEKELAGERLKKKLLTNFREERVIDDSKRVQAKITPVKIRAEQEELELNRRVQQRREQEELKKLKEVWQYDAHSLLVSDIFSLRNYGGEFNYDPNYCLYVDVDHRFRQYVKEAVPNRRQEAGNKAMKWGKLSNYAEKYGFSLDKIITWFNSVSCDNTDLERFLNTGDKSILWTAQEDKDLLENNNIALRYITKIKGPERMKKRREYLLSVV